MRHSLLALALFAVPGIAAATPATMDVLQSALSLTTRPACTICHTTIVGGAGTATKPFVISLESRGFVVGNSASLKNALLALEAEGKDSDGDGVDDITELRKGTDPNVGIDEDSSTPEYGCVATPGAHSGLWAAVAVLMGLALSSRSRRDTTTKSM